MLAGTDQIEILALDLIHHGIHLGKAHNACYYIAADHKGRYTVGKAASDHEVSCIGNHCRVKSGNIAHQIVEAVSCYSSGSIQINAVKTLHDICVVGDLKIRNHWLTELLDLYIFTVILTDGYAWIDDIWDGHHDL